MGWKTIDWKRYQRENDLLRIDVHGDGKTTTVNFSIHPAASSGR
jgi:hypothetical protein